jgi:hypothetical protein
LIRAVASLFAIRFLSITMVALLVLCRFHFRP